MPFKITIIVTKEWNDKYAANVGIVPEWKERETVTLGGDEYIRDEYYFGSDYCYLYMRRIDEDFICIYISAEQALIRQPTITKVCLNDRLLYKQTDCGRTMCAHTFAALYKP